MESLFIWSHVIPFLRMVTGWASASRAHTWCQSWDILRFQTRVYVSHEELSSGTYSLGAPGRGKSSGLLPALCCSGSADGAGFRCGAYSAACGLLGHQAPTSIPTPSPGSRKLLAQKMKLTDCYDSKLQLGGKLALGKYVTHTHTHTHPWIEFDSSQKVNKEHHYRIKAKWLCHLIPKPLHLGLLPVSSLAAEAHLLIL